MPHLNNMVREMRNRSEAVEKPLSKVLETISTQKMWTNLKYLSPQLILVLRILLNARDVRNLLNNRREWNVVFVKTAIASPVLPCAKVLLMLYIVVVAQHGIVITAYMPFPEFKGYLSVWVMSKQM